GEGLGEVAHGRGRIALVDADRGVGVVDTHDPVDSGRERRGRDRHLHRADGHRGGRGVGNQPVGLAGRVRVESQDYVRTSALGDHAEVSEGGRLRHADRASQQVAGRVSAGARELDGVAVGYTRGQRGGGGGRGG